MQSNFAVIFVCTLLFCQKGFSQFLEEPCGTSSLGIKIFGGNNAREQAAIYMAVIKNSSHFLCGGTVIDTSFILTAAHCMEDPNDLFVSLGAYNKSAPTAEFQVVQRIKHPEFNPHAITNDIGLLKLSPTIVYQFNIRPVCILKDKSIKQQVENVLNFEVFGWGKTESGTDSEVLKSLTLRRRSRSECEKMAGSQSLNQICAQGNGGDACVGDSGGPLIVRLNNGLDTQLGIVSYGRIACDGLGVYTDVTSYIDWIVDSIRSNADPVDADQSNFGIQNRKLAVPQIWLHENCGGNTVLSNLRATIYGLRFRTEGVLITERFVLANAHGMSDNAASLSVDVIGGSGSLGEYTVHSVIKHPMYANSPSNDIVLLKLQQPVVQTVGSKPYCMFGQNYIEQNAYPGPPLTILGKRLTQNGVRYYSFDVEKIDSQAFFS
ncbi:complement factor D [Drosophila gunungcola]|uniref:complement factor D n=1 Tax=Drosophila gunungcola TaxID=103775 RepID=UPI0022E69B73|nr:complement factor D [Drosophila gunungcola]